MAAREQKPEQPGKRARTATGAATLSLQIGGLDASLPTIDISARTIDMVPRSHFRPGIFGDGMTTLNLPMGELPPMEILVPDDVLDAKRTAALFAKSAGGVVAGEPVTRKEFEHAKGIAAQHDQAMYAMLDKRIAALEAKANPVEVVCPLSWDDLTPEQQRALSSDSNLDVVLLTPEQSMKLLRPESARAGEGVRDAVGDYHHEITCPECHEAYVWRSAEKNPPIPGCPMCRNRKFQLRLDAERRGQAPIDWQFKGGTWWQYRNGKWIECDPPDSAVAHPAPEV